MADLENQNQSSEELNPKDLNPQNESDVIDETAKDTIEVLLQKAISTLQEEESENSENNEGSEDNETKKPKRKSSVPTTDNDILAVLLFLLPKWDEETYRLLWTTKAEITKTAEAYVSNLKNRKTSGASRGAVSSNLRALDDEIDEIIEHIKNRLYERLKSRKEAIARYREFGIVKDRSYKLPTSREDRLGSLPQLIEALERYNFGDTTFTPEYWTDLYNRYKENMELARTTDGGVSSKVGSLNKYRIEIKKFFKHFHLLIKANHPDDWKAVLRDFGFQKEKY